MKKRLFSVITVSVLLLCLFGAAAAEENDEKDPAWKITESSEITEDARAAFDSAAAELTGAVYEPVALLGEQLDVSRQMVSSLENGRNRMTRMQYLAIRKVIEDEIRQAPEETVLLRDVVRVLVDEPEAFSAEDRARVLADASLISPAIVSKKTTRQSA